MKLVIASDHAGFELKKQMRAVLIRLQYDVQDLGAHSSEPGDDYPDYAEAVGKALQAGTAGRGILICGSGVGVSVAANKMKGIRAAICHDSYSARQGVEHDNMNVLVMGSRVIGSALAEDLMLNFVRATFTNEERHVRRLAKVKKLEERG
jgi:RpiB/LacA/LacB family sugar-phosphate isomerase